MKWGNIALVAGLLGLLALTNALVVLKHLPWGTSYWIELVKLLVLFAIPIRAHQLARKIPADSCSLCRQLLYLSFISAALVSMLTDWAWRSQMMPPFR
jgi:hypothetical protein